MPRAERIELQDPSGSVMADLQAGLATLGPKWGLRPARRHLGRAGARRPGPPLGGGALDRRAGRPRRSGAGSRGRGRAGRERRRAVPDPLARRGRSAARRGDRHLLGLRGRARPQRIDLLRADHGVDRRRLRCFALVGGRGAVRPAARRRADARAADARRGRGERRSRRLRPRPARPRRPDHGLRPSRLPGRGSAGARASPHGPRARVDARRGGRGARARRPGRAAREVPRPRARDERRVLGRRRARDRRDPAADVPGDVRLRPRGRLVGAHRRAAAHRAPDPADGALRRRAGLLAGGG